MPSAPERTAASLLTPCHPSTEDLPRRRIVSQALPDTTGATLSVQLLASWAALLETSPQEPITTTVPAAIAGRIERALATVYLILAPHGSHLTIWHTLTQLPTTIQKLRQIMPWAMTILSPIKPRLHRPTHRTPSHLMHHRRWPTRRSSRLSSRTDGRLSRSATTP